VKEYFLLQSAFLDEGLDAIKQLDPVAASARVGKRVSRRIVKASKHEMILF
jgi:hypothetical protein